MRSIERGRDYESLDSAIARIAYAYGFTQTPVAIPQKYASDDDDPKRDATLSVALIKNTTAGNTPRATWGVAKGAKRSSLLSFAILSTKHPIAHAVVIKTVLAIAESAGFSDLSVSVSSVGDQESKKRFARELGNFFKKHANDLTAALKNAGAANPEKAYTAMLQSNDPLAERLPRRIDYLSENSRKTMLETLSLFESVGINYSLESSLPAESELHAEVQFAIYGTNQKGERVRVASGGRFDEFLKQNGRATESAVSMSLSVPERVHLEEVTEPPTCFVIHVGDVAKLRAFSVIDELWKANLVVGQSLMAENLRVQMDHARDIGAKTVAIIGQREALDNTVIVRSLTTQMQTTLPVEKLVSHVSRRRS